MLAKQYRLSKEKDINRVFKNKSTLFGKSVILNWTTNQSTNSRFAFVVSNKTFAKAVDRNYYKRILRDIIYQLIKDIPTNLDIVLVIKKEIDQMNFSAVLEDIRGLIKKLKK